MRAYTVEWLDVRNYFLSLRKLQKVGLHCDILCTDTDSQLTKTTVNIVLII